MKRRDLFRQFMVGGAVLFIAPSVLTSCQTEDPTDNGGGNNGGNDLTVDLTNPAFSALNNAGGHIVTGGVIVINTGAGGFAALSATCTHEGCTVGFNNGTGNIQCPCHGSTFSTAGSVLVGPASSPLPKYTVSKSGNVLTIIK